MDGLEFDAAAHALNTKPIDGSGGSSSGGGGAQAGEQWTGGDYVENLEGGGPAYLWRDSAGNVLATKDPNPPNTPAGLPAGTRMPTAPDKNLAYLPNGEVISRDVYMGLSEADKLGLSSVGIDEFNRRWGHDIQRVGTYDPQGAIRQGEASIQVNIGGGGTSVPYGATELTFGDKKYPITYDGQGMPKIEGLPSGAIFNMYDEGGRSVFQKEDEAVASQIVSLPNGELVDRSFYLSLNPEAKAVLEAGGTEGYDKYFKANNMQIDTGDWVPKGLFTGENALPTEITDPITGEKVNPQQILRTRGLDAFNDWVKIFNAKATTAQVISITNSGLDIIRTARENAQFAANHIQVGLEENNEWITKTDYDALNPQMQQALLSGGFAALDISGLTSWDKLDKYKEWGLVSPLAEYTGQKDGEPTYSLPQGAMPWENVTAISHTDSSGLGQEGALVLRMLASFAAKETPDLINAGTISKIKTSSIFDKPTTEQAEALNSWWDGLSVPERQQIAGRWRNAPANIQELVASWAPKTEPVLPAEKLSVVYPLTQAYGGMSFSELAQEFGADETAAHKIREGLQQLYQENLILDTSDTNIKKLWDSFTPEERGRVLAASTTTKQQRDKEQYNQAISNTKEWLGSVVEWAQTKVAGGDNPAEQFVRSIGSGIVQLGTGLIGIGLAEIEITGSLMQGNYKTAGLTAAQVPLGMIAGGEATVQKIIQNPVTGLGEAVGMFLAVPILLKVPKYIKTTVSSAKVAGSTAGIPSRAIAGSDYSAFYVEPPKGLRLLATDIKELVAQNKELAHEILYNPKGNKLSVNDQVSMIKKMLNPEGQLRLDVGLDIVNDITRGPAAPKAMYMRPVDAIAAAKSVPSNAVAEAITRWAKRSDVEIGGSTAELAQARGIKNYHVPNDIDYYALSGSVDALAKALVDEIAKVIGKRRVRYSGGTIEIKIGGEWVTHGTIHTTTEFGEGLPFGIKPRIVNIDGVKFMDFREQALRRFRSIITPTGEGRTGVEQAWRAKDYAGWDRIVNLSSEVLKQNNKVSAANLLNSKAKALEDIPAGRKLNLNEFYFDENGMTVGDLVEAVGEAQAKTLTAEPIQVRPPKSAEILSDSVDAVIDADIAKAKEILYSGKYSREEQVAWIKSRLTPEEQARVDVLTNILKSIDDSPAIPKSMYRRAVDAFNMIENSPGKAVSTPLTKWFKSNSDNVAVGGRVAVNAQNKGSRYVKPAGDLDIIVLKGDAGARAANLTDALNKALGGKGRASYGQLDKDSAFIEVFIDEFGNVKTGYTEVMRIEFHKRGMYEPHMPFGSSEKYITIDGIKFQDLRQQIANRVDSALHLKGLGQVDVRWAGRLKDLANLDREVMTYAEGLRRNGRASQAKALDYQIEQFEKMPRGEAIPVEKYVEASSGIRVDKFIKGAPRTQTADVPVKYRAKGSDTPSSYELIRQTTPMSRMVPNVVWHAARDRSMLRGFEKDGKITPGKMYNAEGKAIKAPRMEIFDSLNAALNYLIDPVTGKLPKDFTLWGVRVTAEDLASGKIGMAFRAEPLGIKKGVMRRGVLDEGTINCDIYPTAPNSLSLSKRGVTGGISGESITNFSLYGQTVPIIWGRTLNAMKAGLETPDTSLLNTVRTLAFKETFRDLLHPHLPKNFKVSTSSKPIPSSSLIRFGKETYTWRKSNTPVSKAPASELARDIQKTNNLLDQAAMKEAAPRVKGADIAKADEVINKARGKIDSEVIKNTLDDPAVVEYLRKHARDTAEYYKLRNTYVLNLRKLLTAVGLETAIAGEALLLDSITEKITVGAAPSLLKLSSASPASEKTTVSIKSSTPAPSSVKTTKGSTPATGAVSKTSPSASSSTAPSSPSSPTSPVSPTEPISSRPSPTSPVSPSDTVPPSSPSDDTSTTDDTNPPPPPRRIIRLKKDEKGEGLSKADLAASIAWRMGELKRGDKLVDQYIVVHPPYGPNDKFWTTDVPEGVQIVDGPRSAYDSLRRITKGKLPKEIMMDLGIMDIKITAVSEVPKMRFIADPEQKTNQGHIRVLPRRGSASKVRTSR